MKASVVILCTTLLASCASGPFSAGNNRREAPHAPAGGAEGAIALRSSIDLNAPPAAPRALEPERSLGDLVFQQEQARALEGDKNSALRVALMFREGSHGVPRDEQRMVRWLRHASELDNGYASYQLYLHYLSRGLDRDAVRYENRALRQGYTPPPRLDPRRG